VATRNFLFIKPFAIIISKLIVSSQKNPVLGKKTFDRDRVLQVYLIMSECKSKTRKYTHFEFSTIIAKNCKNEVFGQVFRYSSSPMRHHYWNWNCLEN
jgi:hypothetical protein